MFNNNLTLFYQYILFELRNTISIIIPNLKKKKIIKIIIIIINSRVISETSTGSTNKSTVHLTLTIVVEKSHFDVQSSQLHVSGRNITESKHVKVNINNNINYKKFTMNNKYRIIYSILYFHDYYETDTFHYLILTIFIYNILYFNIFNINVINNYFNLNLKIK